jgi:hypothetical protein
MTELQRDNAFELSGVSGKLLQTLGIFSRCKVNPVTM